ncbi:MAG: heme exporter protein CcmD [Beijerinckiaceae bacterium]
MIELGRHGGFILASYAVSLVVLGGVALATLRRYRRARDRLAALSPSED